ncbi:hypothetical protein KI387_020384 [Taxus chinensis]|uniref:Homologous recombination OB-fold protein OB-fold domain-containing protein n=1 Tax=Taxus chinensis TaxID=29808 RepID=A0AA38GBU0_TAXCH|nr:hypothetical protein KI387_020384 [Taxus chinensis]
MEEDFGRWEELDIDDSDIVKALQGNSLIPPPPLSNILPSKRPPHSPSQNLPATDGILNRFKKQNISQLTNPTLSIPSDLPPLEPCSDGRIPSHTHTTVGIEELQGLDDLLPNHLRQTQPPNNSDQVRVKARVCRLNNNTEEKPETIRRIIPGPAGAVQRALHKNDDKSFLNEQAGPQYAVFSTLRHEEDEVDFEEGPWLCAMDYLHRENSEENLSSNSTLDFIKKRGNIDRIPQVLGIIKTCVPNKLGSMFVTLKDPTGTIGGNIHYKVMEESQIGRYISVGAVLLLRQVVVFSPAPWAHYLNITLTNVVKVFKKGSCLPERQNWRSLNTDMFMKAGTAPLSNNRAPHCDISFSQKKNKAVNHILHSRLLDKNPTDIHSDGIHQHHVTVNNLEGRTASPQEDGYKQAETRRKIASSRICYGEDNDLEEPHIEKNPKPGTSCASQNFEVCCNKKASIPVTIDWNDEVEMLMADQLELFT